MEIESQIWAMLPGAYAALVARVGADVAPAAAARSTAQRTGAVAVIPVLGPLAQRGGGLFELLLGGTSAEWIGATLTQAVNDPQVAGIVLDIDSPGGTVAGIPELADLVHAQRGSKPIIALANGMAASAAYWLATQADEIMVTPSGEVGSIGVFAEHTDYSAMLEQRGIKPSLISAGKYKVEGNPYAALSDEARAAIQERVDDYYGMFVQAVARGRGVSKADVRGGMGEGRMVGAPQALALRMADRVGTLPDAIKRAGQLAGKRARAQALALELGLL